MLIKVRAFPCSKEQGVVKKSEDSFEVMVKAKPERGLANKEILEVLSSYFQIPESDIRMIRGFRERNKIFEIKI
ncbi:MAG: DUF167 domain-containing protein [Candidatus Paceibacterota bacterium]|jgi:hypothetical protein|nr:DUF167 domain-containing protein [Candidatus Paceibacterota bacterium]